MKPSHPMISCLAVLLALSNLTLSAQEPAAESPEKPAASEKPVTSKEEVKPRSDHARTGHPSEVPTPFIGVLTDQVQPELRAQIGLPEGFGLQVVEVMPESPAKEAGIKVHDILVRFDDQKLVNAEQLQALVRDRHKGDEVNLAVITGGKESTVTLRIGERMMPERPSEPHRSMGRFFHHGGGSGGTPPQQGTPMPNLQESVERFQGRLREYQERLEQWSRGGHRGPMPPPPVLERYPGPGEERRPGPPRPYERQERSNERGAGVTRRDDSGVYSLQKDGERMTFSVRPREGGEDSWTFENDTQRSMVPEKYRDKLRMLEEVVDNMNQGDRDDDRPARGPGANAGDKPSSTPQGGHGEDESAPRTKRGDTF